MRQEDTNKPDSKRIETIRPAQQKTIKRELNQSNDDEWRCDRAKKKRRKHCEWEKHSHREITTVTGSTNKDGNSCQ